MKKAAEGTILAVVVSVFLAFSSAAGQQTPSNQKENKKQSPMAKCTMMQAGSSDHSQMEMNARGEKGMGFSQTATQHHFFLTESGGAIQVQVKDASDAAGRSSIRMHLNHIAQAFAEGNFDIPMFVHDAVPPGVPEMKSLRAEIRYSFEELPLGGRVEIASGNPRAIDAVHRFLRFQIREHKTGDSAAILKNLP